MVAPSHVQAATLERFIASWREYNADTLLKTLSQDSKIQCLPLTLGVPERSREELSVLMTKVIQVMVNYQMDIRRIVHDTERGTAAVYVTSNADTRFDDGFKFTNEYAVFLKFTEDGEEVLEMDEMVDTAFYHEFFVRLEKYLAEHGDVV